MFLGSFPTFEIQGRQRSVDASPSGRKYTSWSHAAECTKHNQLCIGFSTRDLHLRFNNHRSEINSGKITCELVKHFHDNDCDFRKNLHVYILEDNLPLSKTSCELREDHWILKLKTKEPFGMNSYVNSLAKSFYELF